MTIDHTSADILCVDDEPDFADLTATHLERFDDQFTTTVKTNAEDALEFLHENHVDCIVSDYNMPGMDGLAFLQAVRTTDPELPFILFTGRGSEEIASDAISAGVTDYMQKGSGDEVYALLNQRVSNNVRRYKSRREKREVEIRAETILNACPDAIVVSVNNEFVYANPKASDLYGVPDNASLLGRNVDDFIHPDYREVIGRKLQSVQSGEKPTNHIPRTLFTIGGKEITVEVIARHVSWEGEPGVVAIVRDLTEREQRARSPGRFRALFEQANDAIAFVEFQDGTPIIQEVNSTFESLFASDEDVVGRDIDEVVADGERVAEAKEISQRSMNGEVVREELTRETVEGPRDFLWQRIPLGDAQAGENETVFAIYTDITERRERQQELEQTNALLSTLFETLPTGVTVLDTDGRITRANRRAEEVFGLTESEITQRTYDDPEWQIIDEDGNPIRGEDLPFARVMESGERVLDYEHGIRWPDGTERWLSINATPLATETGGVEQVVAVITDITDQRNQEQALRRQNERLEEFASIASHDLRNPLNVAEGRLELAREECDSDHLDDVIRAHERMDILIDDLLTLAREGKTVGDVESVDLRALTENCWRNVATTEATLTADIDRRIQADQSRLQQLLENLIRNAVQHGGEDVWVTIGPLDDGFYVEDDGPGIPADERAEVFQAGYSTSESGTGFGLSIVKQVAQAHGWSVRVTEGSEGGARFEVTGVKFSAE